MICGSSTELQLCKQGSLTIATTSTTKNFNNNLQINDVELLRKAFIPFFFPLPPNQMVLISISWEGEDVFFDILNCDLTLWEAFLLSCQSLYVLCRKFCESITYVIPFLLLQSLKFSFHPKVPDSSNLGFQNFQQLFITPIVDDAYHLLPPLTNNVVVAYIFPCFGVFTE